MAFINSNQGDPSHTTTTRSWIGVDLEVRPLVAFINSDRGKASLTPPPLGSGSKNSEHLLEVYDRIRTRASMMKGPGCSPDVEVTDGRLGCGPDVDVSR